MNFADVRRKQIKWAIQQNPVEITIKRIEKVRSGGAYQEVESDKGPFTVRIYSKRTLMPQEISTYVGKKQVDTNYGMLADEDADIKAGPNVIDSFEAYGQTFQVVDVRPQVCQGEIVGYQAALERVK